MNGIIVGTHVSVTGVAKRLHPADMRSTRRGHSWLDAFSAYPAASHRSGAEHPAPALACVPAHLAGVARARKRFPVQDRMFRR